MRVTRLVVLGLVLSAALLACGGDDDDGEAATTTAGSGTPAEGDGDAVTIASFAFEPQELTVAAGTTVTWTNDDDTDHSIENTSDLSFESDDLGQGDIFTFDFADAGEYSYVCGIHDFMTGTITVQG